MKEIQRHEDSMQTDDRGYSLGKSLLVMIVSITLMISGFWIAEIDSPTRMADNSTTMVVSQDAKLSPES